MIFIKIYFLFLLSLKSGFAEIELINSTIQTVHNKRIRNGYNVDISYANFYVFVLCGDNTCGGTLIRQNKVITAAQCVDTCSVRQFKVAVGLNSYPELSTAKKYKAKSIRYHSEYDEDYPYPYDVVVITLKQNVDLNNRVGTINYANIIPPVGSWLCIYGYGYVNDNKQRPYNLQKAAANVIKRNRTLIYTQAKFGPNALKGDLGGPALYNNQLAGVISGTLHNKAKKNTFVAIAHPKILKFIRKYAP